jgi:hypothetical protein
MGENYKEPTAKMVGKKATKIEKLSKSTDDKVVDILTKILQLMQDAASDDKTYREEQNNMAEAKALEKSKKDAELLQTLKAAKGTKTKQDNKSADKLEKDTGKGPFTIIEDILNSFGGAKTAMSLLTNIGKFFLTNPIGLALIAGTSLLALLATDKHSSETSKGIINAGSADGGTAESIIQTAEQTTAIERRKQNILADRPAEKKSMLFWKDGDLQTAYLKEIGWDDKTGTTKVERDGGMIGIDNSGKPIMQAKGVSAEEAAKSRSDFAKTDPRLVGGGGGESSGASTTSASPAASGSSTPSATPVSSESSTPATTPSATPSSTMAETAVPAPASNAGQQLTQATSENMNMKLTEQSESSAKADVFNNTTSKTIQKNTKGKSPLPAVRNQEETFQRMIFNNTRVV